MSYHKVVGYFAYISKYEVFCDGDACVIAGSEQKMKGYLSKMSRKDVSKHTIKKTKFGEIMSGINYGAPYCFDEEAYNRFYPLAQKEGLDIGPENFSKKTSTGMHFVKIQKISMNDHLN